MASSAFVSALFSPKLHSRSLQDSQPSICMLHSTPSSSTTTTRRQFLFFLATSSLIAHPLASNATSSTSPKFIQDDSGILYLDEKIGSGNYPRANDLVIVDYIGYLSNGVVFDNTTTKGRKPLAFQIGTKKVIPGLELALMSMKPGGVRKVIVPSSLAYGERGVCVDEQGCLIPPNETLEYIVTLRRVSVSPI
mmetsp:Transcript_7577/g.13723  ORF Transcript_7577/g.13723 Transcript_7577/m.13723 type:complete len:193 (-) Transcript_7577:41-619(-)